MGTIIKERVEKMRAYMRENGFNAFVVVVSYNDLFAVTFFEFVDGV